MEMIKKVIKSIILLIFMIVIGVLIIDYFTYMENIRIGCGYHPPLISERIYYKLTEPKVPKPYPYEKAFEILESEIKNNDELNFKKANENFEINECFFLNYDYIDMQNEKYSVLSLLYKDYLDNTNIHPDFIDEKNKIAIILTNKKAWKKKRAYYISFKDEGIIYNYNSTYFEGDRIHNQRSDKEMTEKADKIYTVFALYNINFIEEEGEEKAREYIRTIPKIVNEFRERLKQPYGWYGFPVNTDIDRRNVETTSE